MGRTMFFQVGEGGCAGGLGEGAEILFSSERERGGLRVVRVGGGLLLGRLGVVYVGRDGPGRDAYPGDEVGGRRESGASQSHRAATRGQSRRRRGQLQRRFHLI
jgi:hypothetical protein